MEVVRWPKKQPPKAHRPKQREEHDLQLPSLTPQISPPQTAQTSNDYQKYAEALKTIALTAPGLHETELRILLELTIRALKEPDAIISASSRELANTTRTSRRSVQPALDRLGERGLITYREGTATKATTIRVNILQTLHMGGATVAPPQADQNQEWRNRCATTPPTQVLPAVESMELFANPAPPLDIESASISDSVLDRMLSATPDKADPEQMKNARDWVHGYQCKFGRDPNPHAPDARFLAQLTAIASPEQIRAVLQQLMIERQTPGDKWVWYITVALQRIHGIPWQQVRAAREAWKVHKGRPAATVDTAAMLSDLAKRKAL